MMYFITFLCIVIAFACAIAVAWIVANVIMKRDAKRNAKEVAEYNEAISRARQSRYWTHYEYSKVEDVEYEDVSDVKLLED